MKHDWLGLLLAGALVFELVILAAPAGAAHFSVDSRQDVGDVAPGDGACQAADGSCTLRAAIQEANALPGPDAITVPEGRFVVTAVSAPVDEDAAVSGDLDITDDLALSGAGPERTLLRGKHARDEFGNPLDRIFHVLAPAVVDISELTIQGGIHYWGGGIWNEGTLRLSNVRVTRNRACLGESAPEGFGAGISNEGSLTLLNVSLDRNVACGMTSGGGALENYGDATLTNVTVVRNRAARGAAIYNGEFTGTLTLTNVTITQNKSRSRVPNFGTGAALLNAGTAALTNVTVAGNLASASETTGAGAIDSRFGSSGSQTVVFTNTIVASNRPRNCLGRVFPPAPGSPLDGFLDSRGHNLEDGNNVTCGFWAGTDQSYADPMLGRLPGRELLATLPLLPGSPAIDAGDDIACPLTDGRGAPRPADGDGDAVPVCDIGAYEAQP